MGARLPSATTEIDLVTGSLSSTCQAPRRLAAGRGRGGREAILGESQDAIHLGELRCLRSAEVGRDGVVGLVLERAGAALDQRDRALGEVRKVLDLAAAGSISVGDINRRSISSYYRNRGNDRNWSRRDRWDRHRSRGVEPAWRTLD